jgi:hypothetical protein
MRDDAIDSIVLRIQSLDVLELQELIRRLGWNAPPDIGVREPLLPTLPSSGGTAVAPIDITFTTTAYAEDET